jgi:hypothetical protein
MKKIILILILMLIFAVPCSAAEITGLIENCSLSGSVLNVSIDGVVYQSENNFLNSTIIYAYRHNQPLTLDHTANIINSVFVVQTAEYYSKIISLFIGAVSAGAFALGLGVKIS